MSILNNEEITSHTMTTHDKQVEILKQIILEKNKALTSSHAEQNRQKVILERFKMDRTAALAQVEELKRSTSWRLTAPIRFISHIVRVGFSLTRIKLRNLLHYIIPYYWLNTIHVSRHNITNSSAIIAIIRKRCEATKILSAVDAICPPTSMLWPDIDIGIVTYNSQRWIDGFVLSLLNLDYPKEKITLRFIDNGSTDSTLNDLHAISSTLQQAGFTVEIFQRPNRGFGAGHNAAIGAGKAPFCLVTNIDLTFEANALSIIVATALVDDHRAAAWELRQKPYEHPKFYDPITGTTNWNSHACVLLRRSAFDDISGYDENLFMYGEDVEISYRLRRAGYLLRYCPAASVWHYTYENAHQIKPLQYSGSTFASLYLRLKYGNAIDLCMIPLLGVRLLFATEAYPGSRRHITRNWVKLIALAPSALHARQRSSAFFPFREWDYDLTREGAFIPQGPLPESQPLISIITRTYGGREVYLQQALLSVAHQTWKHLEHIIVEDGGETMRTLVEKVTKTTGMTTQFIANGKFGRSNAGNAGLAIAKGRWCLFLDDDDLLFADHLELLATTLLENPSAVASYSLAWEVITDTTQLSEGSYMEISHYVPPGMRQDFDYKILRQHNFMAIQSVLFERELYMQHNGFEEDMDALEDWVLWARYAYGNQFVYVPKVTSMFRTPADPVKIQQRMNTFHAAHSQAAARIEEHIAKIDQKKSIVTTKYLTQHMEWNSI